MEDVVKYLLSFGYLIAQTENGVVVWHKTNVNSRAIPERVFHHALRLVGQENEYDIEDEIRNPIKVSSCHGVGDEI
jgi:hypothetical protein